MPDLIEKLIDSVQSLACIRYLKTGKDLYFNGAYEQALQAHVKDESHNQSISEIIGKSKDITAKAHFTYCQHLDNVFKGNKCKTTFAEEILGHNKYLSLRTLITYKGVDSMLIIISKDNAPFSLDLTSANHIQ